MSPTATLRNARVTIFSLRKKRTCSLRVITFVDVQFSAQTLVKTKKKVITSAFVQFFAQNQVKTKKKIITSAGRGV